MSTYTIGQVADRSGFSASALRYYEGIGLVAPAARTDAGYRLYDDATLARLAFVARAKQLGCSLREITDLISVWDGDRCGPVQRRFHELVTDKFHTAQHQVVELTAFASQLQTAAQHLSSAPIDGPCGDDCACVISASRASQSAGALCSQPVDGPIACNLEPGDMPDRIAGWKAILDRQVRSRAADGALRIEFADEVDLVELSRLVAAEQHCCAFFSFAITVDARGVGLEVRAPDEATEIVFSLFGEPASVAASMSALPQSPQSSPPG